jgi:hypothetical protein
MRRHVGRWPRTQVGSRSTQDPRTKGIKTSETMKKSMAEPLPKPSTNVGSSPGGPTTSARTARNQPASVKLLRAMLKSPPRMQGLFIARSTCPSIAKKETLTPAYPMPVVRYAEPTRMPCGSNALSTLNVKRCSGGHSTEEHNPWIVAKFNPLVAAIPTPPLVPLSDRGLWHAAASVACQPARTSFPRSSAMRSPGQWCSWNITTSAEVSPSRP